MNERDFDNIRVPLYSVGGVLALGTMLLLLVGVPEVRWFCVFTLPFGVLCAIGIRVWYRLRYKRARRLIWTRRVQHFHWPQPIS